MWSTSYPPWKSYVFHTQLWYSNHAIFESSTLISQRNLRLTGKVWKTCLVMGLDQKKQNYMQPAGDTIKVILKSAPFQINPIRLYAKLGYITRCNLDKMTSYNRWRTASSFLQETYSTPWLNSTNRTYLTTTVSRKCLLFSPFLFGTCFNPARDLCDNLRERGENFTTIFWKVTQWCVQS